ncbi:MAG: hypothetical protein L6R43_19540 [Planctomycetes bacterium]|nr:hypothetical protein [Planctomycetota bacterium]
MAKAKKAVAKGKGTRKGEAPKKAPQAAEPKAPAPDLAALRAPVDEALTALTVAEAEAHEAVEKAKTRVAEAKDAFRRVLTPYRDACKKAGVACEFEGGRGANVSEKVSFEVEKVAKGIRVQVKGKPETEEVIPLADLKESVNKAAYAYTDKHVGPREKVGNKGGSLSNRLRAALK